MKNAFLMLTLMVSILAGAAYAAEDSQPSADPSVNASTSAASTETKCAGEQPALQGDSQAPQNNVEYGGGA